MNILDALTGEHGAHFDVEERMAFPLATTLLGEVRLVELGARWAERRAVWVEPAAC